MANKKAFRLQEPEGFFILKTNTKSSVCSLEFESKACLAPKTGVPTTGRDDRFWGQT
jgi:hypothetical protein